MKPIQLGFMDNGTGKHQSNTVWYIGGVCPCISTLGSGKSCGGTQQIKVMVNESINSYQYTSNSKEKEI